MTGFLVRVEGRQGADCADVILTAGREITVGRRPERDIFLRDVRVARHHLWLRHEGGRARASNKIGWAAFRLNGNRAANEVDVGAGDTISLGDSRIALDALPAVEAAWLAWNGGTVPQLARAVRGEGELWHHDFGRGNDVPPVDADPAAIALLADALEDSGCSDPHLLGHLRRPGGHWRGCWAVNLLLGKQ
jgi:hypothetical protein